ncbi:MAG: hypothetical protein ACYC1M_04305 [Armatimonadota bacterium]
MNTSDPKQQKQLLLLILLAVCLIVAVFYQTGVNKPVLPGSTAKVDRKKLESGVVTVTLPFIRPAGNERDPFVTPEQFDEIPNMATNSPNTPGRVGPRPSGLMPLPDLPAQSNVVGPASGQGSPVQTPIPPVVYTPPEFKLLGTIVGDHQMAIIKGAAGGDQVALGDQAADGSRLITVTRESATFVKEGKSYTLTVGED